MAKKKSPARPATSVARKRPQPAVAAKKGAAKTGGAMPKPPAGKVSGKQSAAKAATKKAGGIQKAPAAKSAKAAKPATPKPPTLGRPKVTGEERLYMLFKEDYHARQVFEFLRVDTVKDLEQYSATEIIRKLSQPVRTTVERIRQTLANYNRCLAEDLEYALEQKRERGE